MTVNSTSPRYYKYHAIIDRPTFTVNVPLEEKKCKNIKNDKNNSNFNVHFFLHRSRLVDEQMVARSVITMGEN